MADYDILLGEVMPFVDGCSVPLAISRIRLATIELCRESLIVKRTLTGQSVVVDEPYVVVPVPTDQSVVHIRNMQIDGFDIAHRSQDALDLAWRDENAGRALFSDYHYQGYNPDPEGWRTYKQERPGAYYLEMDDSLGTRIRLVGISRQAYSTLSYQLVLEPTIDSTTFATWVLNDYAETIAAGAIARLLAIPKKPWTDLASAAVYRATFNDGLGKAMGDGARDFTRDDESTGRTTAYV